MAGNPKYYWDSWAFIRWLKGSGSPNEIEGLSNIVKAVEEARATLFTSALTTNEVLDGQMTEKQKESFKKLFQQKNVVVVDITNRVLEKSKSIREWNGKISTPDAIHLATAILYEADEFDTNDGGGKRKRPGDLIPLSGKVAGHALKIVNPLAAQPKLFYEKGTTHEKETRVEETKSESTVVQGSSSGHPKGEAGAEKTTAKEKVEPGHREIDLDSE